MIEFNGFDELGVSHDEPQDPLSRKLDHLIHSVFAQNDLGAELIATWQKALIMTPTVTPNSTQFQAGIEEGKKEFIRLILLTIQSVEDGNV